MARIDDNPEEFDYLDRTTPRKVNQEPSFKEPDALGISTYGNRERNIDTVIRYIPGNRWSVTYYNSIASVNDKAVRISTNLSPAVQKYNSIENLTLFMNNTLESTNLVEQEVDATIDSNLTPYVHDVIVATLMGGRQGIFEVNKVDRITYQNHLVFKITIKFISFVDNNLPVYNNLKEKVVAEYVYDHNFIMEKGSPIILKKDLLLKINIKKIRKEMLDFYLNNFIDGKTKLINIFSKPVMTNEGYDVYKHVYVDPLINSFLNKICSVSDNSLFLEMRTVDYKHDDRLMRTILDAILTRDKDYIYTTNHNLTWVKPYGPRGLPAIRNIYYLNVDKIVDYVDSGYEIDDPTSLNMMHSRGSLGEGIRYPLATKEKDDTHYIFSKWFYNNDFTRMSDFELVIKKFLRGEELNISDIENYTVHYRRWSKYEQFYIIPVLYFILDFFIKKTYSPR